MLNTKNTLLLVFTLIFTQFVFANEKFITKNQVPTAVLDSFAKAFPNATAKRYAKETEKGKVFYEIESKEGNISRDLLFEPNGKIAEIEESIPYDSLPSAIKDTISSKYGKNSFVNAEKVTRPGQPLTYGVVLKVNEKKQEMTFNSDGTRTKSNEESMENEKTEKGERED